MPRKRYFVRIPAPLVPKFGGKELLSERFEDPIKGKLWQAQKKTELLGMVKDARDQADERKVGYEAQSEATFREVVAGWLDEADIKKSTRAWYQLIVNAYLNASFRDTMVHRIGRAAVSAHLEKRKRDGASPDARKKDLTVLRAALNWARQNGIVTDPTAWQIKRPKVTPAVTRVYDPTAMEWWLGTAAEGRDRLALEILVNTGMRRGELRAFKAEWVRWAARSIHIPFDKTFSPKGGKARSVPLTSHLEAALLEFLGDRRTGLVFLPDARGGKRARIDIRLVISRTNAKAKKAARKARRKAVRYKGAHDLRHHCASLLINRGVDVRVVQEIMGHKSLATTQLYAHASPNYLGAAREALEGPVSPKLSPAPAPAAPEAGKKEPALDVDPARVSGTNAEGGT